MRFISTAILTNNTLIDKIYEMGIKVEKIIEAVLLIKRIDLKTPARVKYKKSLDWVTSFINTMLIFI